MQQKCLSEIDFDLIQLDSVNSECLGKLGGKKPSQAILHDLMKLAACAESVQFDLATFCRIYMEYMCAAAAPLSSNCSDPSCFSRYAVISSGRNKSGSKVNTTTGNFHAQYACIMIGSLHLFNIVLT